MAIPSRHGRTRSAQRGCEGEQTGRQGREPNIAGDAGYHARYVDLAERLDVIGADHTTGTKMKRIENFSDVLQKNELLSKSSNDPEKNAERRSVDGDGREATSRVPVEFMSSDGAEAVVGK